MKLILGSASKSRLALLQSVHVYPDHIFSPNIVETILKQEKICDAVYRLSQAKLAKSLESYGASYILCADTLVYCKHRIICKPQNQVEAINTIQLLSGCKHKVCTCVLFFDPKQQHTYCRVVTSVVKFKYLTKMEICKFVQTNEWQGCCGGYRLNGYAGSLIISIQGSYSNIQGLPLYETMCLINSSTFYKKSPISQSP